MSDPFSILGVIGVAAQIIQTTAQFGSDWKHAPSDARGFINELQALKTVLSETNTNILLDPDVQDAFRNRSSTLLSQLGPAARDTETQLMISACKAELDKLLQELKRRVQGRHLGWERLKGAFAAKSTHDAVERLHRQCQTLNALMSIDTMALGAGIYKEVKGTREDVVELRDDFREKMGDKRRKKILNWLTEVDYAPQQHDFTRRRQEGTGKWLLESKEFKTWIGTEKQTLFCPGIPGSGKTILTSIVIDHLQSQYLREPGVGIVYLYLNFRRQGDQNIEALLASLVKQLAQAQPSLPHGVSTLYEQHEKGKTRFSLDEISKTLQSMGGLFTKIFIVVDALDECQTADGCRGRLLSQIFDLQASCGAQFFATARFIPDIIKRFADAMSLEVRASDEDIHMFLEGQMVQLRPFVRRNQPLQEEIKTGIANAVDGM